MSEKAETRLNRLPFEVRRKLVETLAELEHIQWMEWSQALNRGETLSMSRQARWAKLWTEYDKLPEEVKELDRKWAMAALARIEALGLKIEQRTTL